MAILTHAQPDQIEWLDFLALLERRRPDAEEPVGLGLEPLLHPGGALRLGDGRGRRGRRAHAQAAGDRALDGEFYSDFGRMVEEVLGFVEQQLDVPLD